MYVCMCVCISFSASKIRHHWLLQLDEGLAPGASVGDLFLHLPLEPAPRQGPAMADNTRGRTNKLPRHRYWEELWEDPLVVVVRQVVEQRLYLSYWFYRSHHDQFEFRRCCARRWDMASAFTILYEGWLLLGAADRFLVFRAISGFDEEFGKDMLPVLCLGQDPSLETMD